MKTLALLFLLTSAITLSAQDTTQKKTEFKEPIVVEASCGQCQFGMDGKGCTLAVRIDGKTYWVDGTDIHKHGDAHSAEGFCNAIRQAEVTGEIKAGRFKATTFKLLPAKQN